MKSPRYLFYPVVLLLLLMSMTSCLMNRNSQAKDEVADTELGLVQQEQTEDVESTLEEIREMQRQEQKRQLERQINDPLVNGPQ